MKNINQKKNRFKLIQGDDTFSFVLCYFIYEEIHCHCPLF